MRVTLRRVRTAALLGWVLVVSFVVRALLAALGLRRTARILRIEIATPAEAAPPAPADDRLLNVVRRASRGWRSDGRCLARSLTLGTLMRARRPTLVIGAKRHEGAMAAHAWIEANAMRYDVDDESGFVPLRRARP